MEDAIELENLFSEVAVKQVVWGCDSYKTPGQDGISCSSFRLARLLS
jgi:hypothetical protein